MNRMMQSAHWYSTGTVAPVQKHLAAAQQERPENFTESIDVSDKQFQICLDSHDGNDDRYQRLLYSSATPRCAQRLTWPRAWARNVRELSLAKTN